MRKVWILLVIASLSSFVSPQATSAQPDAAVSYREFYEALSPYGQWIKDQHYGFVWLPNVNNDFRPYYTNGHWVMAEYGNTWVSDYAWGWACFHYGRWTYNDFYGWLWIPGAEWGPGWVAWRWGTGLCGWAPLYPDVNYTGVAYDCPEDWWVFMHPRHLYMPRYRNVWRNDFLDGPYHAQKLLQRTSLVINESQSDKSTFYSGPSAADVQQITHLPPVMYNTARATDRGPDRINGSIVSIYRLAKTEPASGSDEPTGFMDAPQQIVAPEGVQTNLDKPRPFKVSLQRHNPAWNRTISRDNPVYFNYPRTRSMEDD